MDADGLTQLLSPEGWALLSALPPYDESRTMALSERLRDEGIDPALVAAALTQSRLRAKAVAKFGTFADGMLFTATGLEQATRLTVAAHHARRFRDAGSTLVADLTSGIGADAMAFAGIGLRVLATDLDEATAAIATVNLRHFPDAVVRHGDGLALDLVAEGVDGVYADPARRTSSGSRVFDPAAYEPSLDAVLAVRETIPALGPRAARRRGARGGADLRRAAADRGGGRIPLRAGRRGDPRGAGRRGRGAGARPARRLLHRLRDVGRPRASAVRDGLPGARRAAVRPDAAPHLPPRAGRGQADHQEARHG